MSAKIIPALVAGLLVGTTSLASAQALVYPYYGYYSYAPVYPPAVTLGVGVPGVYYAPGYSGYYGYAPTYVTPGYEVGWGYW